MPTTAKIYLQDKQLICTGSWNLANLPILEQSFATIIWPSQANLKVNGAGINHMDSAGAWVLSKYLNTLHEAGIITTRENFTPASEALIALVAAQHLPPQETLEKKELRGLACLGQLAIRQLGEAYRYIAFVGMLAIETMRIISHPRQIRWRAFCSNLDKTGYQALPIIGLLSFMIGVVLAYQMGVQLRNYGANVFIVDLLGLSVLREFGPLLGAIMIAGRTGSAFTAELGSMKINQEIDALNTMGVTPSELLLLPKIFGLVIALPLLTIWADIFGVLGGMFMANNLLDISWYDFLQRFSHQVPLKALLIGLGKAPVFALIIASIGCFQGMSVQGSADSLGKNTTKSVVLAIFFIIIADALFSIIFSKLHL